MYEVLVQSTPDERFDGVIEAKVTRALDTLSLSPAYIEGGTSFFAEDQPMSADNNVGIDVDEETARQAAVAIAAEVGRPVTYYPYGDDVDPETAPRFVVTPDAKP